ncbi:MAG: GDP-mannose 4,6-dehydratase [Actinomycetota bacterium]|nr:GDP-mannose 4,6-dehydratase [Actinomycetota bacterium]
MLTLHGKSVLVTGGAGFIGSHLVDRLAAEEPANLVVVDNMFLGDVRNLSSARSSYLALKLHGEDASDWDTMRDILVTEQVDVVFNLAVLPLPTSLDRPRWTVDVNMGIVTVLCELLREKHYETLIHFSSSEVYGTAQRVPMDEDHPVLPLTPYAASKAGGDHVALSYYHTFGLDIAIVRPFNVFGPRQNDGSYAAVIPRVISSALAGREVVIDGDGEQTRDFNFVREVVEVALRVYEKPETRGRVCNVAQGEERSVNSLVERLLEACGVHVPVVHGPVRPGDVRRHSGSSAQTERLLGTYPRWPFEAGLAETVAWYRERLTAGARDDS